MRRTVLLLCALLAAFPAHAVFKNVAGQKLAVYAYDTANGAPKTGDAANITAQVSKDGAACAPSNDVNPTELDATNAPGVYLFDLSQAETNCDLLVFTATSATADVHIEPVIAYTQVQQTGDSYAVVSDATNGNAAIKTAVDGVPTTAEFEARTKPAADYFDPATDTVVNVTTVASVTNPVTAGTVSDKTGYSLAVAPLDAAGVRAAVGLAAANLDTQLSTIDNYLDTEIAAILEDTGTTLDDKIDRIKAAVYDSATRSGTTITLSNGATQVVDSNGRTTTEP